MSSEVVVGMPISDPTTEADVATESKQVRPHEKISQVQGVVLGVSASIDIAQAKSEAKANPSCCWRWRLTMALVACASVIFIAGILIAAVLLGNQTASSTPSAGAILRGELLLSVDDAAGFVGHASSKLALAAALSRLHDAIHPDQVIIDSLHLANATLLRGGSRRIAALPVLAGYAITLGGFDSDTDAVADALNAKNSSELSANLVQTMRQASMNFTITVVYMKSSPQTEKSGELQEHDKHDQRHVDEKHRGDHARTEEGEGEKGAKGRKGGKSGRGQEEDENDGKGRKGGGNREDDKNRRGGR